jgi:hypothetical protein
MNLLNILLIFTNINIAISTIFICPSYKIIKLNNFKEKVLDLINKKYQFYYNKTITMYDNLNSEEINKINHIILTIF